MVTGQRLVPPRMVILEVPLDGGGRIPLLRSYMAVRVPFFFGNYLFTTARALSQYSLEV
jgi:hypothetical protein